MTNNTIATVVALKDGSALHQIKGDGFDSIATSKIKGAKTFITNSGINTFAGDTKSDTTGYIIKSLVITDNNGNSKTSFVRVNESDDNDYTIVGNTMIESTPYESGNSIEINTLDNGIMYILTKTKLKNNLVVE
jgi:hypothetical protein